MTKQRNKKVFFVFCTMVVIALFMLSLNLVKEGYLGYLLIRSTTLNEILFFINNVPSLSDVYLVSVVKSMSDVNITLIKFIQALEFKHVMAPVLLLLVFDMNRVYYKNNFIKFGIIFYVSAILVKYIIVLVVGVFVTPSVMNPTILFEAVGFTLIIQQIGTLVTIVSIFAGTLLLTRNEES